MADYSQQNHPSAEMIKIMVSLFDRAIYAQQCCTTIIVCKKCLYMHAPAHTHTHTHTQKEQLCIASAIIDFLNHHSGLKEKKKLERLQLVAYKFKMFHKVAKAKEQQGLRELKKSKPKNLSE